MNPSTGRWSVLFLALFIGPWCPDRRHVHLPIGEAERLTIRGPDDAVVGTVSDRAKIEELNVTLDSLDGWFDDIFSESGQPLASVELVGASGPFGKLYVSDTHVRYVPGKGAARLSRAQRDRILSLVGLPNTQGLRHEGGV